MNQLRRLPYSLALLFAAMVLLILLAMNTPPVMAGTSSPGALAIVKNGHLSDFCPLRHTDVKAGISGFVARVMVTQLFANTSTEKIEAVYTFPLPPDAAVDDMTIRVGDRTIRGEIKRREEAAAIYKQAIQQGKMAALLDQERPNIFSQTIGNIPPGETVEVTISYLARLRYEDGGYEFSFPTVVGPRYIPGAEAMGRKGGGVAPDTDQVPDASKITPPVAANASRAGHDISIAVALDAGVPIRDLRSPSHQIDVDRTDPASAAVRLHQAAEIPNRDFILRYAVAGPAMVEGVLTHTAATGPQVVNASAPTAAPVNGYFSLIIQPPERFPESDVTRKELVFVLDSSGSMNGFPEAKAKQLIDYAIDGLYPGDTFNVIKFSGDTAVLFAQPVYPTADNVQHAKRFVNEAWGGGGTEMMQAIRAALAPSASPDHLRVVVFLTDGYVGNDMDIIAEVQKHPNARVFAYGVGSSVNHFLLDGMAKAGRGEVEYVSHKQDDQEAAAAAHRLYERLRAPLLTDIKLDFGSLPVTNVYPREIPDLFSAKPIVITGRYRTAAEGVLRITARRAGDPYSREIPISLPANQTAHGEVASLWAREKIEELMSQDWSGLQHDNMKPELRKEITQLGLDYRLITQFTSFVAVEERMVTEGGKPKRIQVPVELPEGVQYEPGWSGSDSAGYTFAAAVNQKNGPPAALAGGVIGGIPGGVASAKPSRVAVPPPPPPANGTGSIGAGKAPGVGPGLGGGYGGGRYRVSDAVRSRDKLRKDEPRSVDAKLHPQLVALFDCSQQKEGCKPATENVLVEVIITGDADAALRHLKAVGFAPQSGPARPGHLIGTIAVAKLAALADISAVQFVAPVHQGKS